MPYTSPINGSYGRFQPYLGGYPAPPQIRRLLLLGKQEDAATALQNYCRTLGWQVDCAYELEEAEALLACFSYAAVVTDLSLAGVDGPAGLKIVGLVRARCPRTRVFLWTPFYSAQLEAAAHECGGVDGFLPKPFPVKDLARAVCVASEHFYV
jgi:DNA-binding response OmpR family regulator